jgi:hypothetical protein
MSTRVNPKTHAQPKCGRNSSLPIFFLFPFVPFPHVQAAGGVAAVIHGCPLRTCTSPALIFLFRSGVFPTENFLWGLENNARFLFDTENKNLSYMFVSYLTLPLVWVPNSAKSYVKSPFYPWRFISNTDIPLLISLEIFVPLEYMNKRIRLTTLNGNTGLTKLKKTKTRATVQCLKTKDSKKQLLNIQIR